MQVCMHAWMDGCMDGWMDGCHACICAVSICMHKYTCVYIYILEMHSIYIHTQYTIVIPICLNFIENQPHASTKHS